MQHPWKRLSFLAVLLYVTACTPRSSVSLAEEEQVAVAGKWNLISDSTYAGVGAGNHPVDYTGGTGDYFAFTYDGHVYTKEGNVLDTLTYQMVPSNRIIISGFGLIVNGVQDTSTVSGLTFPIDSNGMAGTIVIESPWFPTPGGLFWRKVTLGR